MGARTGIEWVVVDSDGTRRDLVRYQQAGTTPAPEHTLTIERHVIDPDPADTAPAWARAALHPTPRPVVVPPVVEVIEAEVEAPRPALTPDEYARLLAQQTREIA